MLVTTMIFTILIFLALVGINSNLVDIKKLAISYMENRLAEMKIFTGPGDAPHDKT
jgi:hypothetical protein